MKTEAQQKVRCSECGMPKSEWTVNHGAGIIRSEKPYCCEGCADGTGCTCI